jgi:hypothetical protein
MYHIQDSRCIKDYREYPGIRHNKSSYQYNSDPDTGNAAISTDGCVMLTTTGSDENGSFSSRAMALDVADLHRSGMGDADTKSDLAVRSTGPLLFSD